MTIKADVLWEVKPCRLLEIDPCYGGTSKQQKKRLSFHLKKHAKEYLKIFGICYGKIDLTWSQVHQY